MDGPKPSGRPAAAGVFVSLAHTASHVIPISHVIPAQAGIQQRQSDRPSVTP